MKDQFGASVLVFGGPYSNLRAVKALLTRASELDIAADRCICTGDVAAYCAEPEETAIAIRDWDCHVVAGNCEEALGASAANCGCGFEQDSECDRLATGWYPFANERLSIDTRAWMGKLPKSLTFTVAGISFRVIHGGVNRINRFVFASEPQTIAEELELACADVVVAGHAGLPFIRKRGTRVWFNPGVIGVPANDGTPDVWFGLIQRQADHVVLSTHRLAYDYRGAAAAMRRSGHGNEYARALVTGLWPSLDVLPAKEKQATGSKIRDCALRIDCPFNHYRDRTADVRNF